MPGKILESLLPVPHVGIDRYLLVALADNWTAVLNNARLGTDVGMLPSAAARRRNWLAIRAVAIEDSPNRFGATILEVYEPTAAPPLRCRRSLSAANDGGRWRFQQSGMPYPFEATNAYKHGTIRNRFACEMLHNYLNGLAVPPFSLDSLNELSSVLIEAHRKN